jgi:heptosyltransferase-2
VALPEGGGIWAAAELIRSANYDVAVVFPNSLRAGLEVWLAGVPVRAGYSGHFRGRLLNSLCPRGSAATQSAGPRHQVHHYLDLAIYLGAPPLPEADWVDRRTVPAGAGKDRPWRVAVCPGAEYGPAKRWLPERFAQVIRLVSEKRTVEWTLVGVAKDAPVGAAIEAEVDAASGVHFRNRIGGTSLGELVRLLEESDMLLTNDTGTMHLAASLGVQVVAVFGSTDAGLTGPLGAGHRVLQHKVPCGPCFQRECHLDFACMRGVSAGEAVLAVESVLRSEDTGEKGSPAPLG